MLPTGSLVRFSGLAGTGVLTSEIAIVLLFALVDSRRAKLFLDSCTMAPSFH